MPVALDRIGLRLEEINEELLPQEAVTGAKVFQVGGHLFAEAPSTAGPIATLADEVLPDFSSAVTRPVGFGNLQVVRQELIGYEAGEISHIENVLEGEELRRSTHRTETSDVIETDETVSIQSQERDHQSTDRNELATETQKEAGHQSSTAGAGMTSTDYGKLVENSRSNFAQTVVARSVELVTSEIRTQRVRRESRTYIERVRHVLDNHDGTAKVRGIYQWVDKRYSLRVLNYGRPWKLGPGCWLRTPRRTRRGRTTMTSSSWIAPAGPGIDACRVPAPSASGSSSTLRGRHRAGRRGFLGPQ